MAISDKPSGGRHHTVVFRRYKERIENARQLKNLRSFLHPTTANFSLFMVDKDGKEQPMVKITYKREK